MKNLGLIIGILLISSALIVFAQIFYVILNIDSLGFNNKAVILYSRQPSSTISILPILAAAFSIAGAMLINQFYKGKRAVSKCQKGLRNTF